MFWFPFSGADASGNVNYRSTETLYYNEYWYEYEYVGSGNTIEYSVDSDVSYITFAIWDEPFDNFGTKTVLGSSADIFSLQHNQYEYWWLFLKPGSTINYQFNSSGLVDFFIANSQQLSEWNAGFSPSFFEESNDVTNGTGIFVVPTTSDYYLVWYNEGGTAVNVEYDLDYSAEDVIDFSSADYVSEMVISANGDFIVPSSGDWYFFIFFEPMNSPEESTWITFDVTYQTGLTPNDRWINILPILIIIAVIIIGIIIIAAVARRGQKRMATKEGVKSEEIVGPQKETKPKKETPKEVAPVSNRICHRCGSDVKPDALFCPSCGGKLEGRQVVTSPKNTPVASKNCTFCGSKISVSDNYCKWCGTKIEK